LVFLFLQGNYIKKLLRVCGNRVKNRQSILATVWHQEFNQDEGAIGRWALGV
jgi:hypothetical protein